MLLAMTRLGAALLLSVSVLACAVRPALAEAPAAPAGPFSEAEIDKFCIAMTKAAHPTITKPGMLSHSESTKDGVLLVKMQSKYHGGLTNKRYTADSLLHIQLPKKAGDPYEVLKVDFVDVNNPIAPNQKNLKRLLDEMNARFRIDAAK